PTTFSLASATMPMQFRCRRQRMKSSSYQGNSKQSCSILSTSGMSRRIIQRMCTASGEIVRNGISDDTNWLIHTFLRLMNWEIRNTVWLRRERVPGGAFARQILRAQAKLAGKPRNAVNRFVLGPFSGSRRVTILHQVCIFDRIFIEVAQQRDRA